MAGFREYHEGGRRFRVVSIRKPDPKATFGTVRYNVLQQQRVGLSRLIMGNWQTISEERISDHDAACMARHERIMRIGG